MTTNEITQLDATGGANEIARVVGQVAQIQTLMKKVMIEDTHYGLIPGCGDKPALFQAGAQKLNLLFRLGVDDELTEVNDLGNGHREYTTKLYLTHLTTGQRISVGVGSCSTRENKYLYRWENTGEEVPRDYWDSRDPAIIGGASFAPRKIKGKWFVFHRAEHDNPADYYNTARKIAFKRAYLHATLNATAASDIFTQDIEPEDFDNEDATIPADAPTQRTRPQPKSNGNGNGVGNRDNAGEVQLISEPQRKRLFAKKNAAGVSDQALDDYMLNVHEIESTNDIPRGRVYDQICDWLDAGGQ